MSMVTVAMVAPPITPTPAAIPPPRQVSFFEFFASTPPQTSPKSSWFSPNNGRAENLPPDAVNSVDAEENRRVLRQILLHLDCDGVDVFKLNEILNFLVM